MRILILNGPNLNLLGNREVSWYGDTAFEPFLEQLRSDFADHTLDYRQSNVEGELVTLVQQARNDYDALIVNLAGYSHTSVALADALEIFEGPKVEVHISNVYQREDFRQRMITAAKCDGIIGGLGFEGYRLAVGYLISELVD